MRRNKVKYKGRLRQIVECAVVEAERSWKWTEVVKSSQKSSEMKTLDFTSQREYLVRGVAAPLVLVRMQGLAF